MPEISQYLPPPLPSLPSPSAPASLVPLHEVEGIARLYRRLVLLVGLQILVSLFQIPAQSSPSSQPGPLALVVVLVLLIVLIAIAVTAYQLTSLLGSSYAILWAIAMFLPCLNILFLLVLSSNAQSWCHRHGIKVGFLGPTTESIEELRRRSSGLPYDGGRSA